MAKRAQGDAAGSLDRGRSLRRPVRALHYWIPIPRVFDAWAGGRDGRQDGRIAVAVASGGDNGDGYRPSSTLWLKRNGHTFAERDRREFLHAQAVVAGQRSSLHRLYEAADRQAGEVGRLRAQRDAQSEQPSEAELQVRGPAEGLDSPEVIAKRRRAVHAARLAGLDGQLQAATGQATQIAEQIAALEGELITVFEITVTRSHQLRFYHERRAAVYRRWHRRAWRRRTRANPAVADWPIHETDDTIPAPAWTAGPCAWIRSRASESAETVQAS